MSSQWDSLTDKAVAFIQAQPMFFVATAAADGRVNISPKGMDSLRVLAADRIVWLNLTGSGNETAAHLLENPRMTLMFCSFTRKAEILRAYGTARGIRPDSPDSPDWLELAAHFPPFAGARQIFDLTVDLVTSSCGLGVPEMAFVRDRGQAELEPIWAARGKRGVAEYQRTKNAVSLDGKPTDIPPLPAEAGGVVT